jgi:hypothetical protein
MADRLGAEHRRRSVTKRAATEVTSTTAYKRVDGAMELTRIGKRFDRDNFYHPERNQSGYF